MEAQDRDIYCKVINPVSEFNELKPPMKSPKNRFQLSSGLSIKNLNTILSGTNYV